MPDLRSHSLVLSLLLVAACNSQQPNDDDDVVLTTSTGDMSTGITTNVSTVTGVPTTQPTTMSTTDITGTGDSTDVTGEPTTDPSTTDNSICGDAQVEGAEECDDGNTEDDDDCKSDCTLPSCGDGIVYKGVEECDDGNDNENDSCTSFCKDAECGDGFQYLGFEECDDGNTDNSDDCTEVCTLAKCGDGFVQGDEVCDDTKNNNEYNGCAPGCGERGPYCGDDVVQKNEGERCDTSPPHVSVTCNDDCTFNFAAATQMYCAVSCSWDAQPGCQKGDADIFCRLKLGSSTAKAKSFDPDVNIGKPTNGSGFPCANVNAPIQNDQRLNLGALPEFGVGKPVLWQNKDILKTHGDGDTLVQIECVD